MLPYVDNWICLDKRSEDLLKAYYLACSIQLKKKGGSNGEKIALSKIKAFFRKKIDASTKRPILILPFKTSLNDFIPDNQEFQVEPTLV